MMFKFHLSDVRGHRYVDVDETEEVYGDIDFLYDVDITAVDLADFMFPNNKEENEEYLRKLCDMEYDEYSYEEDYVINLPGFDEFIEERYYDDAVREYYKEEF